MKTKVSFISRMFAVAMALVLTTSAFADGETTDVYTSGSCNNVEAGDFTVRTTSDVFNFQGQAYEVYKVYYTDPARNMNIAVNTEGKCKSFIAYNKDYTLFYDCTKEGFGARKIMFSSPSAQQNWDAEEFANQTVLRKDRKMDKKQAIELIAAFLPDMKS